MAISTTELKTALAKNLGSEKYKMRLTEILANLYLRSDSHFEEHVSGEHVHAYPDHEHGVVLSMPGVVTLQQTSAHGLTRASQLR